MIRNIEKLEHLPLHIVQTRNSLENFTLCLRACLISADCSDLEDFKELRKNVFEDSITYCQIVLPIAKQIFSDIKSFFTLASYLDSPLELKENIGEFIQTVEELKINLDLSMTMHEDVLATAQQRSIIAEKMLKKLGLEKKYIEECILSAKKNQTNYERDRDLAKQELSLCWIHFIPVIGIIKAVSDKAEYNKKSKMVEDEIKKLVASKSKSECITLAVQQIENGICPALNEYIEAMKVILSILCHFINDMKTLENSSQSLDQCTDSRLAFLFKVITRVAKSLMDESDQMCGFFCQVQATFQAFWSFENSNSYVKEWLLSFQKNSSQSLFERIKQKALRFLKTKPLMGSDVVV